MLAIRYVRDARSIYVLMNTSKYIRVHLLSVNTELRFDVYMYITRIEGINIIQKNIERKLSLYNLKHNTCKELHSLTTRLLERYNLEDDNLGALFNMYTHTVLFPKSHAIVIGIASSINDNCHLQYLRNIYNENIDDARRVIYVEILREIEEILQITND